MSASPTISFRPSIAASNRKRTTARRSIGSACRRTLLRRGFWSISHYNAKDYFAANDLNAYSINNLTARTGQSIQVGGCASGRLQREITGTFRVGVRSRKEGWRTSSNEAKQKAYLSTGQCDRALFGLISRNAQLRSGNLLVSPG